MAAEGMESRVICRLHLDFPSREEAEKVHRSVELDNQGYVRTRIEGKSIVAEIDASSLNSLLHTLDDFLACASVAERIVSKKP
ncbi:MAG: KEOPS complex subunit Pcc1 [Thermoplasmata archaeon]